MCFLTIDSYESWKILDLSVAMAYAMLTAYGKQNQSIAAASALLRGYAKEYPLKDAEVQYLHLLICCRLACSVTLGAFSYQQNPGNEYLLLHAEPAWEALELIWGHEETKRAKIASTLENLFRQACNTQGKKNVEISDLAFPDPIIPDALASLRNDSPRSKRKEMCSEKKTITFVTGNKKKLEEFRRILGNDLPFEIVNEKVDLPELQGDPVEVARKKCLEAAQLLDGAVITEDTSLCFNSLQGLPGPYIKWFLEKCGLDGLNKMIEAFDDKSAYAQTIFAFCPGGNKPVEIFDGRTRGKIVPARGKLDFGWDPIFEPDEGDGLTYGEMNKEQKDAISHRGRSMKLLKEFLSKQNCF